MHVTPAQATRSPVVSSRPKRTHPSQNSRLQMSQRQVTESFWSHEKQFAFGLFVYADLLSPFVEEAVIVVIWRQVDERFGTRTFFDF